MGVIACFEDREIRYIRIRKHNISQKEAVKGVKIQFGSFIYTPLTAIHLFAKKGVKMESIFEEGRVEVERW